ncbi:hypothetical protein BSPWISOXPB_2503 [uncultured Gammaproteobacteria bacterium]|nr:hypothetical protein BSPWISOXPB_2503 [uncultured Gammaproteobacteria bacterium]
MFGLFSGVEKASAVVIRSAPLSSGLPPVLALVTVTVMVFSVVWGSKVQSKKEIRYQGRL